MPALLYLVHRVPYPPNKGDKVRSFHILKRLAREYEVHLGTFADDAADLRHADRLRDWCADVHIQPIRPAWRKLLSLRGLVTGEALTLPFYHSATMARWVRGKLTGDIDRVVAFSAAMAQYLPRPESGKDHQMRSVVDLVDVDSEKWRAYAPHHRWPLNWVYAREGRRLLAFERQRAAWHDATVLVSAKEAQLFRHLAPEIPGAKIHAVHNGVDACYFSPHDRHPSPYAGDEPVLVFTGAMDYWANADAVQWFADEIFPRVLAYEPRARFYIVGARPLPAVERLGQRPGIHVSGSVADVRPYLAHARVAVAPLRIARGIQNKVLEAMAMARPVVATSAAMDGIDIGASLHDWMADEPGEFAQRCLALLAAPVGDDVGRRGRELVLRTYSWEESLTPFMDLLGSTAMREPADGLSAPSADALEARG